MKTFLYALTFFLLSAGTVRSQSLLKDVEKFNIEIGKTATIPEQRRSVYIKSRYLAYFSKVSLHSLKSEELKGLFTASLNASSLSRDAHIAKQARFVFDEMNSRKILSGPDYQYMQGLYVRLRLFDAAKHFHEEFREETGLESIPKINYLQHDQIVRTVFTVENQKEQINRVQFNITDDFFILVIAHPLCHFTQDAAISIDSDPQLKDFFSKHSKWLMPDDFRFSLSEIRRWNALFPNYKLSMVDNIHQWGEIESWDTPTFYFYRHGKVVSVIRGWPKGGHLNELNSLLDKYRDTKSI